MHEVAFVNEADTGSSAERCDDRRVAEDRGRIFDGRDIGLDLRLLLRMRAIWVSICCCETASVPTFSKRSRSRFVFARSASSSAFLAAAWSSCAL